MSAYLLLPQHQINTDDQSKCRRYDYTRGRGHRAHHALQKQICSDANILHDLFQIDVRKHFLQPPRLQIQTIQIGNPLRQARFNQQIKPFHGACKLWYEQCEYKRKHQRNTDKGEQKRSEPVNLVGRLLFRFLHPFAQPLFDSRHGHIDKQGQDSADYDRQDDRYPLFQKLENHM